MSTAALLAHGTSLCFILGHPQAQASRPAPRPRPASRRRLTPPPKPPPAYDTPDPWERDPVGEVVDQDTWDRLSGLEAVRAAIARELPRPPIHHFIGIEVRAASEGEATFAIPATEWLHSAAARPPPGRCRRPARGDRAEHRDPDDAPGRHGARADRPQGELSAPGGRRRTRADRRRPRDAPRTPPRGRERDGARRRRTARGAGDRLGDDPPRPRGRALSQPHLAPAAQ